MAIVLEREIERAVERRLTPQPPRRTAQPVVRFSPMFAEPTLAARKRRRTLVWVSVATHVLLLAVVVLMPRRAQTLVEPALPLEIVFTAALPTVPELKLPAPAPPKPLPRKPEPKPRHEEPETAAEPPPVTPAPVVETPPAPVAKVEPPRPRPAVRTGLLDELGGPPIATSSKSRSSIVATSGFDTEAPGGAPASRTPGRVVEVAAFDAAPARAGAARRASAAVVQETGFAEEAAPAPKKHEAQRTPSPLDAEVEILVRPKPVYTEDARAMRLEGDVVLSVVFEASGVLRILGVAQGLGHGLDEAAVEAARKIRFNPARRDGGPVDFAAKLRVVFRLA